MRDANCVGEGAGCPGTSEPGDLPALRLKIRAAHVYLHGASCAQSSWLILPATALPIQGISTVPPLPEHRLPQNTLANPFDHTTLDHCHFVFSSARYSPSISSPSSISRASRRCQLSVADNCQSSMYIISSLIAFASHTCPPGRAAVSLIAHLSQAAYVTSTLAFTPSHICLLVSLPALAQRRVSSSVITLPRRRALPSGSAPLPCLLCPVNRVCSFVIALLASSQATWP